MVEIHKYDQQDRAEDNSKSVGVFYGRLLLDCLRLYSKKNPNFSIDFTNMLSLGVGSGIAELDFVNYIKPKKAVFIDKKPLVSSDSTKNLIVLQTGIFTYLSNSENFSSEQEKFNIVTAVNLEYFLTAKVLSELLDLLANVMILGGVFLPLYLDKGVSKSVRHTNFSLVEISEINHIYVKK